MNTNLAIGLTIAGICVGLAQPTTVSAQQVPSPTRKILDVDLPNLAGQEVLIFTTDWAPGQSLHCHMHPDGHEFAYIIDGELTFNVKDVGEKVVKAGEVNYIAPGIPHYGRNASDKPARTLVVRIKDKSKPLVAQLDSSSCP